MKSQMMVAGLVLTLISTSAFAAQFECTGKSRDENGNWTKTKVTVDLDESSLTVKEEDGTQFGFGMEANLDSDYRASAKYAGYYRYNATKETSGGWDDILVQKPMRDNKRARAGAVVLQGSLESSGEAAYFNSCRRVD